jgi:hypothetical protein
VFLAESARAGQRYSDGGVGHGTEILDQKDRAPR